MSVSEASLKVQGGAGGVSSETTSTSHKEKETTKESSNERVTQLPTKTTITSEGGGETIVTETKKVREEEGRGFLTTAVRGWEETNKWVEKEDPRITVTTTGGLQKEVDKSKETTKEIEDERVKKAKAEEEARLKAEADAKAKADEQATKEKSILKKSGSNSKVGSRTGSKATSRNASPKNKDSAEKQKPVLVKEGSFTYVVEGDKKIPHYMIPQDRTVIEKEIVIPDKHVMPFVPVEAPPPSIHVEPSHDHMSEVVTEKTVKKPEPEVKAPVEPNRDHKIEETNTKVKAKGEDEEEPLESEKKVGKRAVPEEKEIVRQPVPAAKIETPVVAKPAETPKKVEEIAVSAKPIEKPKVEVKAKVTKSKAESEGKTTSGRQSERKIDVQKSVTTQQDVEENDDEIIETTTKTTRIVKNITTTIVDGQPVPNEPADAQAAIDEDDEEINQKLEILEGKTGLRLKDGADIKNFSKSTNYRDEEDVRGYEASAKLIENEDYSDEDVEVTTVVTKTVKTITGKMVNGEFVPDEDQDVVETVETETKTGKEKSPRSRPKAVAAGNKKSFAKTELKPQSTSDSKSVSTSSRVVTKTETVEEIIEEGGEDVETNKGKRAPQTVTNTVKAPIQKTPIPAPVQKTPVPTPKSTKDFSEKIEKTVVSSSNQKVVSGSQSPSKSNTTRRVITNPDGSTTVIEETTTVTKTITEEELEEGAEIPELGEDINNEETTEEVTVTQNPDGGETKTTNRNTTKVTKTVTEEIIEDEETPEFGEKQQAGTTTTSSKTVVTSNMKSGQTATDKTNIQKKPTGQSSKTEESRTKVTKTATEEYIEDESNASPDLSQHKGARVTQTTSSNVRAGKPAQEVESTNYEVKEVSVADLDKMSSASKSVSRTKARTIPADETEVTEERSSKITKTVTEEVLDEDGNPISSKTVVTVQDGDQGEEQIVESSSMSKTGKTVEYSTGGNAKGKIVSSSSAQASGSSAGIKSAFGDKKFDSKDGGSKTEVIETINPDGSKTITETTTQTITTQEEFDVDEEGNEIVRKN